MTIFSKLWKKRSKEKRRMWKWWSTKTRKKITEKMKLIFHIFIQIFWRKIIHEWQKNKWRLHFMSPSNILLVFLQRNIVESFNLCKINDVIIFFGIRWFHRDLHFFEPFSNGIQFIFGDLFLIHINEAVHISNFTWNTKWNTFVATWNN